jgi:hypothetical protein
MAFKLSMMVDEQNNYNASDDDYSSTSDDTVQNLNMADVDGEEASLTASSSSANVDCLQYSDVDLSHFDIDTIPPHYTTSNSTYQPNWVRNLSLHHNQIAEIPYTISVFTQLIALDVSNNQLYELPSALTNLVNLRVLILKNNHLDSFSFPKNFGCMSKLEVLNLSGNQMEEMPLSIADLPSLKALYMGGNQLKTLPCKIGDILTLEMLYLGGNQLRDVPATIGKLKNLLSLILCGNRLETIPSTVVNLQRLENLSLHNNQLRTLPTEIVTLRNLQELSLRSNPLVVRFVRDMTFDPPSMKELAGRAVKLNKFEYKYNEVPFSLVEYLDSAHQCVNPKCKGVYFEAKVEHVKFVDFCGKFRVPLLQYLCSPKCGTHPAYAYTDVSSDGDSSDLDEEAVPSSKLKKVLLG